MYRMDPYPSSGKPVEPDRGEAPPSVQKAVKLMYAGAAVSTVSLIVSVILPLSDIAGSKAAVSSLRDPELALPEPARQELLATIEKSTDQMAALVENLLAMSRLQAGALSVAARLLTASPSAAVGAGGALRKCC